MRSALGLAATLIVLMGCTEREVGVTERDAIDLGFELVDCRPSLAGRTYVMPDSSAEVADYCRAIAEAHREAVNADVVSRERLSADSIAVITSWIGHYPQTPGDSDWPESFFDVTFDFRSSNDNIPSDLESTYG